MKKIKCFIDYFVFHGHRTDRVELRKGRFFVCTIFIIILVGLANVVYFLLQPKPGYMGAAGSMLNDILSFFIILYYRVRGNRVAATNLFNFLSYSLLGVLIYIESGGIYSSDLAFFGVNAAWTFLIADRRSGIAWFLVSTAAVILYYTLEVTGERLFMPFFNKLPPEYSLMNNLAILLFLYFIVSTHDKNQRTYIGEIEDKNKEIEQKNKEILDSIRYAERIQRAQLPSEKIVDKTLKKLRKTE